ncbi:endonuclease III [Abditibacteriota bacterium]|nr:endonuclease III [Abditibacteriota bacterium]
MNNCGKGFAFDGYMPDKIPFDLDVAFERIEDAIAPYPKAALFQLKEDGYSSVFEQLIACLLSIRTYDEIAFPATIRLFERARTPAQILELSLAEVDALIKPCTYHENKAPQILAIAKRTVEEFGGELPCDRDVLVSLHGIGPKCANLTLGIACGLPFIGVDIHVHRVTNRWAYVQTKTPEKTMVALENKLPREHWVDINRLLVPFGKHICTGDLPKCSTCPLLEMCPQIGVSKHR